MMVTAVVHVAVQARVVHIVVGERTLERMRASKHRCTSMLHRQRTYKAVLKEFDFRHVCVDSFLRAYL